MRKNKWVTGKWAAVISGRILSDVQQTSQNAIEVQYFTKQLHCKIWHREDNP